VLEEKACKEPVEESGRILWILGKRCVETSLPAGTTRCFSLPLELKPGSRAVGCGPDEALILENGSSRLLRLRLQESVVEEITSASEGSRFRSSLGSRLVLLGKRLLVTGTPGRGAHTPWLFDLAEGCWTRLPEAPHPIPSSAVLGTVDSVTIIGGWSKERSCHGYTQTLSFQKGIWNSSTSSGPWRRPGAGCIMRGIGALVAMGWMESKGQIGQPSFQLLRRNGAAQLAASSSSKLVKVGVDGSMQEIAQMPCADSYEHNGEVYAMGEDVVCIGRDHIQAFNMAKGSWRKWELPGQLGRDNSNSWVKHCGSWALAWLK